MSTSSGGSGVIDTFHLLDIYPSGNNASYGNQMLDCVTTILKTHSYGSGDSYKIPEMIALGCPCVLELKGEGRCTLFHPQLSRRDTQSSICRYCVSYDLIR